MRKLSAGVILTNGSEFLACKVTTQNFWDIPKGETEFEDGTLLTCIRETHEETGLTLETNKLIDMGVFGYTKKKRLHLYLYHTNNLPDIDDMNCDSHFVGKNGEKIPEMSGYEYVSFLEANKYMGKNMCKVLVKVKDEIDRLLKRKAL